MAAGNPRLGGDHTGCGDHTDCAVGGAAMGGDASKEAGVASNADEVDADADDNAIDRADDVAADKDAGAGAGRNEDGNWAGVIGGGRGGARWVSPRCSAILAARIALRREMVEGSIVVGLLKADIAGFPTSYRGYSSTGTVRLGKAKLCRRTRTTKTATSSTTTPRGGPTPPPRRAQPLLLLSRSNPPTEGGGIIKLYFLRSTPIKLKLCEPQGLCIIRAHTKF